MSNRKPRRDPGQRLPLLFFDASENNRLKDAGERLGKTIVEAHTENLPVLFEEGLKKDTLYFALCDKDSLCTNIAKTEAIQRYFRLGINIPSFENIVLDDLLQKDVNVLLAADREDQDWFVHFKRAQNFLMYIDPLFQPQLVLNYRKLHSVVHEEPQQELELDTEKARMTLSDAEVRILEKILEGKSNRRIAEECFLAVATVNNHVSHLTKKMHANDRTHTIKRAIEEGWVEIS
ncbi:response regulator transcription factor [Alteribacillus sp. HJP-4]|uniref:response regulator transcription factor n=1 Tax=Alteribacillus sp. HJP-4 TaxID=2775394 RepID=UPI0035CD2C79